MHPSNPSASTPKISLSTLLRTSNNLAPSKTAGLAANPASPPLLAQAPNTTALPSLSREPAKQSPNAVLHPLHPPSAQISQVVPCPVRPVDTASAVHQKAFDTSATRQAAKHKYCRTSTLASEHSTSTAPKPASMVQTQ